MGVHGLWKLLEPSGQMVPLESLAGKVLAVDVSIWLHQAIKGMHDTYGAPMEAAHLIILFHRLCKLLFYKIKPVFVFDGGVPALKHQTLAARRQQTNVAKSEVLKVREKLIKNLLKHEAVRQVLSNETASAALGLNSFALPGPSVEEDLYKLPPMAANYDDDVSSEEMEEEEEENEESAKHFENIHSVDVTSQEFLSLPPEVRHDILTELIETRKQSSWKHLDSMPSDSDDFSDFQMSRLLKRHAVQTSLEKAGKEMGGRALSLKELESMLGDKGVVDPDACLSGRRIAQDSVTRYMLIHKDEIPESGDATSKETDGKDFDIMNRLDEVQWSSDSDTDVILEKSRKVKRVDDRKQETESGTLAKRPVVQMTKEIADILTILEGEDVEPDMKAKWQSIQDRFTIKGNTAVIKTEPVDDFFDSKPMDTNQESIVKDIKTETIERKPTISADSEPTAEEILNVLMKNEPSDEEEKEDSLKCEPTKGDRTGSNLDVEIKAEDANIHQEKTDNSVILEVKDLKMETEESGTIQPSKEKVFEVSESEGINDVGHIETTESAKSREEFSKESSPVTVEEKEERIIMSESSSDSDNDFVSISVAERETQVEKPEKVVGSSSETFQTLSITVSPSKIGEEDDIFADVFQSDPQSKTVVEVENKKESFLDIRNDNNDNDDGEKMEDNKPEFGKEMSKEELNDMKKTLEEEQFDLMIERGKQERQALNPTDQMYSDAQELLRLFGIPFIVAPMEAEAQCACLDTLGLTEGTITDDSDIWLFGGRVVYKNFFNQKKHVLEYRALNIQKCFKLNREDLIRMAMLVGSDYTVGLNGIGPVTALEILASFPSPGESMFEGLEKFRDWFIGRNPTTSPRTSLKRKIRNTVISPGFPNKAVADAYLHPQVDDSKEPFSWAKPNLELIRKYVKLKIGWSPDRCNNLLLPVLKKMEESSSQSVMERYLRSVPNTVGVLSKRVEKAIKRLEGGEEEGESVDEPKPKRKRKEKKEGDGEPEKTNKRRKGRKGDKKDDEGENADEEMGFKISPKPDSHEQHRPGPSSQKTKEILIKEKLHREEIIPQKERTQKMLEDRKKEAIEIFRTFKGKGQKKKKVFAKKEANLSESSSENSD